MDPRGVSGSVATEDGGGGYTPVEANEINHYEQRDTADCRDCDDGGHGAII